jgi:hypothetical protein
MSSNTDVSLNPLGNYTNGVISDVAAVVTTQALDTCKTYQLSGNGLPPPLSTIANSIRSGTGIPPLRHLRNGVLFNGTLANCSGAVVQGGLPFLVNGMLADTVARNRALTKGEQVGIAVTTGLFTSTMIAPFERWCKIHQLLGGTAASAFWSAIKTGSGGLFKAIGPVALRDAMVSGAFFGGRPVVENQLEGLVQDRRKREGLASIIMGIFAGALSTPADKINVLMQGDIVNKYPSTLRTAKMLIQNDGIRGLFRGAFIRSGFLGAYMLVLGFGERNFRNYLPSIFHRQ